MLIHTMTVRETNAIGQESGECLFEFEDNKRPKKIGVSTKRDKSFKRFAIFAKYLMMWAPNKWKVLILLHFNL